MRVDRPAWTGPGASVPGALRAVPVDVARHPLGVDLRHQPLHARGAAGGARRTRLLRGREVLLEALLAGIAPILVDRHGASVLARSLRSRPAQGAVRAAGRDARGRRPRGGTEVPTHDPPGARGARAQDPRRHRLGMTLASLAERIRAKEVSPREAVQASLDAIEANVELNSFISVRGEEALAEAATAPAGPLHGVPVAIKDVIDVAGA